MRIGFIGNQNNYPFMLARGLRARGHDVRVVIDQQHPLDRPESRYSDISYPYPDWIVEVPSIQMEDIAFRSKRWQDALENVRDCDALVLNKWAYDAASVLPIPAFCLTTGGDVEFYANPAAAEAFACSVEGQPREGGWLSKAMALDRVDWASIAPVLYSSPAPLHRALSKQLFLQFVRRQRAGLRRAVAISGLPDGVSPWMAQVLRDCRAPGIPRLHLLMADVEWISPQPLPHNDVLRIFNASRILWKKPFAPMIGDWVNKGTDVLLRGVALWHARTGKRADVRLVEKGPSVRATKDLVRALGLEAVVSWQPELTQAGVFEEYAQADIVSEQCGAHVLGMAGWEAMAAGRPVIANGRPDLYASIPPGPAPVAQASTPEDVAAQLVRLSDPEERRRLGDAGRRFVVEHLSVGGAARQVETVLEVAVRQRSFSTARQASTPNLTPCEEVRR